MFKHGSVRRCDSGSATAQDPPSTAPQTRREGHDYATRNGQDSAAPNNGRVFIVRTTARRQRTGCRLVHADNDGKRRRGGWAVSDAVVGGDGARVRLGGCQARDPDRRAGCGSVHVGPTVAGGAHHQVVPDPGAAIVGGCVNATMTLRDPIGLLSVIVGARRRRARGHQRRARRGRAQSDPVVGGDGAPVAVGRCEVCDGDRRLMCLTSVGGAPGRRGARSAVDS